FFQAEDGIRDLIVTGVQTCALPIWVDKLRHAAPDQRPAVWREFYKATDPVESTPENEAIEGYFRRIQIANQRFRESGEAGWLTEIGRASCRERVWIGEGAGAWKKVE